MPTHRAAASPHVSQRWPSRSAALLALLMLGASCVSDMSAELPERAPNQQYQGTAVEAETDTEERVLAVLPTNFPATRISQEQFTRALVNLVEDMPLPVKETLRSLPDSGRRIVLASGVTTGAAWLTPLAQDYGRFCAQRGTPGDCLNRFDDGPELDDDDKRAISLALAIGPALDAADAEIRAMISPTRLLTMVSISITGYMALLIVPEPISKGVAAVATVLLWGYLGWELWDLIRAYIRLSEESAQATRFDQLREAGNRFASTIGPNSVRIIVLVGTAAVGGTLSLASKAPKLPGFGQVARTAEATGGVRAATAAGGAERVIISASEGSVRAVLPRNAMAMSSESSQATARAGALLSTAYRAFKSFRAFKRAMGSAGEGMNWHHIIEQHAANLKRFGPEALHNTENVIKLDTPLHNRVSAFYSSVRKELTNSTLTIRQWLSTQSYEAQRQFGLRAIENIQKGIW
jgi:hypothetical protein